MLTFEQIKELVELVARRGLGGLELERSGFRLKIDGPAPEPPAPAAASTASRDPAPAEAATEPGASAPPPRPPAATAGAEPEAAPEAAEEPPAGSQAVHSPIVGTFYRASSPDADPFVELGSRVKRGEVLCIVEAMKIMNEIESEVAGEVVAIYPDNAQPVEYGEPLFAIRPG